MVKRAKLVSSAQTDLPGQFDREAISISVKDALSIDALKKALVTLGYESMNLSPVEQPGQFSVRGGVVDIWLERYRNPVRIDLFGERVESMYLFDPRDHSPIRNIDHIDIFRYLFTSSKKIKWPKEVLGKFERLLLSDIAAGDLVVHIDHGIGRFLRIEERNLEGKARHYLIVEYAKGEKLFVPVEQIDRLSKYIGVTGKIPALSFLGTEAWERTKRSVSHDLIKVARELLKLYAEREAKRRPPYSQDSDWQREVESAFPYQLTPSQEKSWLEIRSDLESDRPIDRLLVGDVGFGKTELALRAAFKAVQSGYQVVLLVPTTILAEQHYFVFNERLGRYPVSLAKLSRLQTEVEQKKIVSGLNNGEIDLVIGTHRLLSDDVNPKKLGLLIIDEEHRFGVLHKEKLKKLRSAVDVLSLSATPIPRTLYLSITKLRDVSLIADPIPGRLPVSNVITGYDSSLVANAIKNEIKRGGQVYYLSNRVRTISAETERLRKLVPGAKINFAHGVMGERALDRTMQQFLTKEIDVLVCTTIIGSGIDIPSANTIIIRDAHRLGLADLYQLRGRVGRAENQGYCFFFYPKGYQPKGAVRERLEAIAEAEELGSGFSLAERDLEIRGAGNILGVEQHGNVSLVGFELYIQLLSRAVEKLSL